MMSMYIPILFVVFCNVLYQICAKSIHPQIDPLASLVVTYLVGAATAAAAYLVLHPGQRLWAEYRYLNWTPFALGIAVVGLEVGTIYMYKAGWNVNTGVLVESVLLAVALLAVGALLYHEAITWTKLLGVAICMVGIYFLNK